MNHRLANILRNADPVELIDQPPVTGGRDDPLYREILARKDGIPVSAGMDVAVRPGRRSAVRGVAIAGLVFVVVLLTGTLLSTWVIPNEDTAPVIAPAVTTAPSITEPPIPTTQVTSTTQPPSTTVSPSTTQPPPAPQRTFGQGELDEGTYVTEHMAVPLELSLSEGWFSLPEDPKGSVLLARSEIVCDTGCGSEDGLAVIIREIAAQRDDLATAILDELTDPATIHGTRLIDQSRTEAEYGGHTATVIEFSSSGGTNPGTLTSLWPYEVTTPGIQPLVFAGPHQIVLIDLPDEQTLSVLMILGRGERSPEEIATFEAAVEQLVSDMSTGQ